MSNHEKQPCFIPLQQPDCPETCPGLLATQFMRDEFGGEGYYIQVCPDPAKQGRSNSETNYCGNGPDVIVLFRSTVPTPEEYQEAVDAFNDTW